jgi:hypothetical protein
MIMAQYEYYVVYEVEGFPDVQRAGPYTEGDIVYQRNDIAGYDRVKNVGIDTVLVQQGSNATLTQSEMFERSFQRPKDFFKLDPEEQWAIDKGLGILDWDGSDLSEVDRKRFKEHYQ